LGDAGAQLEVDLALEEAVHRARHDTLTQLPNRALLLDRLGQGLARARRNGSRVAVLFIDLDDFKVVNDTHGHAAGDRVLVTVAEALAHHVRGGDTAARLGGDEFAVLLQDVVRLGEVETVAQRILSSVTRPLSIGGTDVTISASIGIALAEGTDQADDVLRHADRAMYTAKTAGKNRIELFAIGVTPTLF
jgi:diguanylate cyclase (GGDEF)-like protein